MVLSNSIDPIFSYNIVLNVEILQVRLENNGDYVFSIADQDTSIVEVHRTNMLSDFSAIGIGFRNWYSVNSLQLDFKSHIELIE
ncbi:hypothetical protein D3C81_2068940 [compost metagenome]